MWTDWKKRYNVGCNKRITKINDRKRAETKEKPKKHLTRNQYEQKKQKERLKKERQHASQTEEKKQAILARRCELYAENKAKERSTALQEDEKN